MSRWARYRVVGSREYRGHKPGETFIGNVERRAAGRAILRGDIVHLEPVTPELPPAWGLPAGWSSRKEQG